MITVIRHYHMIHKQLPPWRPLVPHTGTRQLFVSDISVLVDRNGHAMNDNFSAIICLAGATAREAVFKSIEDGNVRDTFELNDAELNEHENDPADELYVSLGVDTQRQ